MSKDNPLLADAIDSLRKGSIEGARLLTASYESSDLGNGEAVFQIDSVLLRFVRDRGQDFIDIGSSLLPNELYYFDDFEIAMNWKSINDVLAKTCPDTIDALMVRLGRDIKEIKKRFSSSSIHETMRRLRDAKKLRERKFLSDLGGRPDKG